METRKYVMKKILIKFIFMLDLNISNVTMKVRDSGQPISIRAKSIEVFDNNENNNIKGGEFYIGSQVNSTFIINLFKKILLKINC